MKSDGANLEYETRKKGNVFDTELVNSTIRFHSNEVHFYVSPGIGGEEVIRGVPISIDPEFIKVELLEDVNNFLHAGDGLWINRSSITGCKIFRDDHERLRLAEIGEES